PTLSCRAGATALSAAPAQGADAAAPTPRFCRTCGGRGRTSAGGSRSMLFWGGVKGRKGGPMADAATLRRALATFLGEERFAKVVRQAVNRGRLLYWQEQEWDRFTATHPEFAVSVQELAIALRICELHGVELLPDTVEVFRGCRDYTDKY